MGCCPSSKPAAYTADSPRGASPVPQPSPATKNAGPILDHTGKRIYEFYDFEKKTLGEGGSARVWKAKHKESSNVYAVKHIIKQKVKNIDGFKHEIDILMEMDHPNIVKLHETYEDYRNIYLVMELCAGGELFDRICDGGRFTEADAANLMQQILQTVFYMHKNNICHRDLKPENFLFMTRDKIENNLLKVIDFDRSCRFQPGEGLATKARVSYHVAPEALAGGYSHLCDLWSCGVLMYTMLCGYPPFFGETAGELQRKVIEAKFSFTASDWTKVSDDAKNLIRGLLKKKPSERYTAEQALMNVWIADKAPNGKNVQLDTSFIDRLRTFRQMPKLQMAAARVIASQLTEKQLSKLTESFKALDKNGDGQLTAAELKEGIEKAGLKDIPGDLQQLLDHADADQSGGIDLQEFHTVSIAKRHDLLDRNCWSAFREFDKDGNGVICSQELRQMLASDYFNDEDKEMAVKDILKEVDVKRKQIDFDTFMKIVLRTDAT